MTACRRLCRVDNAAISGVVPVEGAVVKALFVMVACAGCWQMLVDACSGVIHIAVIHR